MPKSIRERIEKSIPALYNRLQPIFRELELERSPALAPYTCLCGADDTVSAPRTYRYGGWRGGTAILEKSFENGILIGR